MTQFFPPHPTDPHDRDRWAIIDALRRYGADSVRLGHGFAARHELQPADLQALVAIMSAERAGEPLTPGRLRTHLGLSSGGTSYVIDRLEAAGHVRRARDHPSDSRVVHLRYTDQGMSVALAFFGPLGQATLEIMDRFDPADIAVIGRFLTSAADALHDEVSSPGPNQEQA